MKRREITHGSQRHHRPPALPMRTTRMTNVRSENRSRGSQLIRRFPAAFAASETAAGLAIGEQLLASPLDGLSMRE